MTDGDPRRAAIAAVRARGKGLHDAGLVLCLAGCLMLIAGRAAPWAPPALAWAGLATIVAGWGLFGAAIWRRVRYLRAHPLPPKS